MNHRLFALLFLIFCIIVTLALLSCNGDSEDAEQETGADPEDDDDDSGDDDDMSPEPTQGCPRAIVTSGLGLGWKWLNHRISYWDVHPEQGDCPSSVPQDAALAFGYVGGSWSTGAVWTDIPILNYRYFAVDAGPDAAFVSYRHDLTIDAPQDIANDVVVIDLEQSGLAGFEHYAVFLAGLTLDTDVEQIDPDYPPDYDPALGYTSRGIGAGISDVTVTDGKLTFGLWARFELGAADREDMNSAIAHARTQATVHMLVAGFDNAAVTSKDHAYQVQYDPPRLVLQPQYDHAPEAMRRFSIQGQPGFDQAFVALQSFNLKLFGSVDRGDYIRTLSVDANLLSYDPATGAAQVDLDGFASNASTAFTEETLENDFTGRVALVQLAGGTVSAGEKTMEFETGADQVPLP